MQRKTWRKCFKKPSNLIFKVIIKFFKLRSLYIIFIFISNLQFYMFYDYGSKEYAVLELRFKET